MSEDEIRVKPDGLTEREDATFSYMTALKEYSNSRSRKTDGMGQIARVMATGRIENSKSLMTAGISYQLDANTAESIYAGNALAKKIVCLPTQYALSNRLGFRFEDMDRVQNMEATNSIYTEIIQAKKLRKLIKTAAIWGRLYGASYLLINAEDGNDPSEELELDKIKEVKWIKLFTPLEMYNLVSNRSLGENFLEPEYYTLGGYVASNEENMEEMEYQIGENLHYSLSLIHI